MDFLDYFENLEIILINSTCLTCFSQHLKEDSHKKFVKNAKNFENLDRAISGGPTWDDFKKRVIAEAEASRLSSTQESDGKGRYAIVR